MHGHSHAAAPSEGGEATAGESTSSGESFEGEGPMEETEVVAPDGTVIKCYYRGVSPTLVPHSREWKKEKRLADNRASAARSRALQRVRVTDMSAQLYALVEANKRLVAENAQLRAALNTPAGAAAVAVPVVPAKATTAAARGAVTRVPRGRSARVPLARTDTEYSNETRVTLTAEAAASSDSDALSMRKRHADVTSAPALLPLDDSDAEEEDQDVDMLRDVVELGVTTTSRRPSSHGVALDRSGVPSPLSDTTASTSTDTSFRNTGAHAPHLPMPMTGALSREFTMASVLSPHMSGDAEMQPLACPPAVSADQAQSFTRLLSLSIPECASPHMLAPVTTASPMVPALPSSSFWSSYVPAGASLLAGSKRRAVEDLDSVVEVQTDGAFELASPPRGQYKRPHMAHMLAVIACVALLMALPTSGVMAGAGDSGIILTRTTAVAARRLMSLDAQIGAVALSMVHANARPVTAPVVTIDVASQGTSVLQGSAITGFLLHYAGWFLVAGLLLATFEVARFSLWRWRDSNVKK